MKSVKKPLHITALFSGGASAVRYLLEHDPNYGKAYVIVGGFTDKEEASGSAIFTERRIPLIAIDFKDFFEALPDHVSRREKRQQYFEVVQYAIKNFESDILMLSGFMLKVRDPLLKEFEGRILNVHPADLTVCGEDGKRKYTGADAVATAIAAGESSTRSTVHIVTKEFDAGPIIAISDPFRVAPGISPREHQEKMKIACDGPAYVNALRLICSVRSEEK